MRHRIEWCAMLLLFAASPGCEQGPKATVNSYFSSMFPPPPSEVARDAFNVYDADKRRRSLNLLSTADWGGEEPYLRTYRLLVDDPDPTVRAAALRALGRHGTPEDVPRIIPYLKDKTSFVRWEAATALQKLHHKDAVDPLIQRLDQEVEDDPDVRIAAAKALAQYPDTDVFQALVAALRDNSYGVVREAHRSLVTLTGEDLGEEGAAWLEWAKQREQLFKNRRKYTYRPYKPPPSFFDKLAFWNLPEEPSPKRPKGIADASGAKPSKQSEGAGS